MRSGAFRGSVRLRRRESSRAETCRRWKGRRRRRGWIRISGPLTLLHPASVKAHKPATGLVVVRMRADPEPRQGVRAKFDIAVSKRAPMNSDADREDACF